MAKRMAEPEISRNAYLYADDFIRLAEAGEPVRRAAAMLDAVSADTAALLSTYEAAIAAFNGPIPATLVEDASDIALDLSTYRAEDDEDGDDALRLLLELDATVSTLVAAERTGRFPHSSAFALTVRLEYTFACSGVAWRSPQLAQFAEDRWLTVGDDPDLVGAYGWLDVLAQGAPSRARIRAVVADAAKRERLIDDAVALLEKP